jgi:excisionase family DNA binding protein
MKRLARRAETEPVLLRIRGAAAMLSVSERSIWQLIRSGQLRAIHPPGMRAIRIARRDVEISWSVGTITGSPSSISSHERNTSVAVVLEFSTTGVPIRGSARHRLAASITGTTRFASMAVATAPARRRTTRGRPRTSKHGSVHASSTVATASAASRTSRSRSSQISTCATTPIFTRRARSEIAKF